MHLLSKRIIYIKVYIIFNMLVDIAKRKPSPSVDRRRLSFFQLNVNQLFPLVQL